MGNTRLKTAVLLALPVVIVVALWAFRPTSAKSNRSETVHDAPPSAQRSLPELSGARMVEVFTPHCSVCKEMAPLVNALVGSCRHQGVLVETVDVSREENEHIIEELEVEAVPTFIFISETGVETTRLVGRQSAEALIEHLSEIGGAKCVVTS